MSEYAETAMLVAAMADDTETLDRLAHDATTSERSYLTKALNRVYDALVRAADDEHDDSHAERCCREHGTHSMPHRGCILR